MKVFGIGLNKTGTRTLSQAMTELGLKTQHWVPKNLNHFAKGRFAELFAVADQFDGLCDWPWPLLVEELAERYADEARFILTTRQDAKTWLKSVSEHARRNDDEAGRRVRERVYGFPNPDGVEGSYLDYYERHPANVRKVLEKRGMENQILTVCWENGDGWPELCSFLNLPTPSKNFPHLNKGQELNQKSATWWKRWRARPF